MIRFDLVLRWTTLPTPHSIQVPSDTRPCSAIATFIATEVDRWLAKGICEEIVA
jgi:hypothetical protein